MSIIRSSNPGAKQEVDSIFHDLGSIKSQHQKVRTLNGSIENRLHIDNGNQSVDYCCDGETPEEKAEEIIQAIPWFIGDLIGHPIELTVEKESDFIIVEKPKRASEIAVPLLEFLEDGYYSPSNKDGEIVKAFKLPNPNLEKYQAIDIEKEHPNFFSYAIRILDRVSTEEPCLIYDWGWNFEGILSQDLGHQLRVPLICNMSLAVQKEPPDNAICYLSCRLGDNPYSFVNGEYGYHWFMVPDPGKIISWSYLRESARENSDLK
ncbi:hypothetical protein IKG10_00595 [Candidatus Saccharibacteria bacterium]|nr:hypothetical protein [Candidatus Saccharibacteria bacterium]MBR3256159.1 hypothetical protein [Candidatus Saccharibacteria bacterium]